MPFWSWPRWVHPTTSEPHWPRLEGIYGMSIKSGMFGVLVTDNDQPSPILNSLSLLLVDPRTVGKLFVDELHPNELYVWPMLCKYCKKVKHSCKCNSFVYFFRARNQWKFWFYVGDGLNADHIRTSMTDDIILHLRTLNMWLRSSKLKRGKIYFYFYYSVKDYAS